MSFSKPAIEARPLQAADRMRWIGAVRVALAMTRMALHVGLATAMIAFLFPFRSRANRQRLIRWWSGRVLRISRLTLRIIGPTGDAVRAVPVIDAALRPGGIGAMFVMNHVSWLDIFIVHSLRPARFVAKAEIARWPLLGYMTDRTGAMFIERGKRHAVREVNQRAAGMLRDGDLIGLFPEGTVGDGRRLLPFHANLIQPAIDAGAPIVVAGLRYRDRHGRPTNAVCYVGEITLFQSLVRIARHGPLVAELHLIDVIDGRTTTRHEVARTARGWIADTLGFDDEAHQAADDLSTVIIVPDDAFVGRKGTAASRDSGTALDPRDELL